ncbi:hypothetical protein GOBAR_DD21336 [Gossypium barbadense]|nr:hypothetical protein GOBAR_DD21336 [Gossypium barbadense]
MHMDMNGIYCQNVSVTGELGFSPWGLPLVVFVVSGDHTPGSRRVTVEPERRCSRPEGAKGLESAARNRLSSGSFGVLCEAGSVRRVWGEGEPALLVHLVWAGARAGAVAVGDGPRECRGRTRGTPFDDRRGAYLRLRSELNEGVVCVFFRVRVRRGARRRLRLVLGVRVRAESAQGWYLVRWAPCSREKGG